jgi:hypothetical protein
MGCKGFVIELSVIRTHKSSLNAADTNHMNLQFACYLFCPGTDKP